MGDDLLYRYPIRHVSDQNDALYAPDVNPYAHRIASIRRVYEATASVIESVHRSGAFPVCIGGDHSVAAGTISALRKCFPEIRLGVVWIDAHADLHTPYTTPSGNFHGMPLAIALGLDNLSRKKNTPVPNTVKEWDEVKNLWDIVPKVRPEDVVFFGVRDTEQEEDGLMNDFNMPNYTVDAIREDGMANCISDAVARLANCDLVYVSFDVDSMDPTHSSHGTGTPVPGGFTPEEAKEIIAELFRNLPVCCFEMVEINPTLDEKGNAMAEVAHAVLSDAIALAERYGEVSKP
jgi:arginase